VSRPLEHVTLVTALLLVGSLGLSAAVAAAQAPTQPLHAAADTDAPHTTAADRAGSHTGHGPDAPVPLARTAGDTQESTSIPTGLKPVEGSQIVARVGDQVVLAADVLVGWSEFLASNSDQIPELERENYRKMFMKQQLEPLLDTKLVYADARRTIPAENFPKIEETLGKKFEEDQVPHLCKTTKTKSRAELDAKLREMGTSLAQRKQAYTETVLYHQWLREQVDDDKEITHDELWDYYQQHLADFEYRAKARWEEILARFDRFPTKDDARQAIAEWGNLVWYRHAPFADVARKHSHGVTAGEGGQYDWTTQGNLRSTVVDEALFTLPVGTLSQILEDEKGFHIVRVLERTSGGRTPFVEAQPEIRRQINQQREQGRRDAYLARLRKITPVWTVFDE